MFGVSSSSISFDVRIIVVRQHMKVCDTICKGSASNEGKGYVLTFKGSSTV